MKWIGKHTPTTIASFPNTIEIRGGDSSITTIDYDASDISTWQLSAKTFDVDDYETAPEALFFKPDGTKMYLIGRSGDDVDEFALSTPWDVTTASYTDQLSGIGNSPTSETNPYGMFFSPDGIYLYVVGSSVDQVAQFTLSTAWDVSTGSYTREQDLLKSDGSDYINPTGIFFKPDGTEFWIVSSTEDTIQKYTLSTAWDVSTISVSHSTSLINFFTSNNLYDPILHGTSDIGSVQDIFFSDDGSRVWLVDSDGDTLYQLDLSTPWDVTTKTYSGQNVITTAYATNSGGIFVSESANKAFIVANSNDMVRTFNFGAATFDTSNDSSVGFKSGLNVKGDSTFDGISSFRQVYSRNAYINGSFTSLSTTSLTNGNGGTTNILDGTTYTNDARLDVMTNIYWGANNIDQSIQNNYQHNINLGRPKTGATVNLNIGRLRDGSGVSADHTGIVKIVSKAQTFDHDGYLKVGQKLEVTGNADLQVFDLGGTVIFSDTFTEANTTALESHTPDTGAGWTKVFDDGATNTWNVVGGGGYASLNATDSDDGIMYLADTLPTSVDYEVRVDFKRRDSGDDTFEIIFKYKDANNFYYLQWSTSYSTYCRLRKVEGGVGSNIEGNFSYGVMNSTSDNLATALKVRFIDNKIMIWDIDSNDFKAYRGSFPVTTDFSDGAGGTYHKVGMGLGDLEGGTLDSTSTWKIDKFELKMLSSAATLAASTKHYIENGNIGIGTTSPSAKLDIYDDSTTYAATILNNNSGGKGLLIKSGNAGGGTNAILDLADKSSNIKLRVVENGNVGIGTTSPSELLHISSGVATHAKILIDAGADADLVLDKGAGSRRSHIDYKVAGTTKWYAGTADSDVVGDGDDYFIGTTVGGTNAEFFLKRSNGNVGIGTTSPQSLLHVHTGDGGTYSPNSSHDDLTIEGSGNVGLQLFSPNSTYQYIAFGDPESVNAGYVRYHHGSNTMVLRTNGQDRVNIDSSGNVGIGTTSPAYPLHVESVSNTIASFKSTDNRANIIIQDNDTLGYINAEGGVLGLGFNASKSVDNININSSGNVGIGTTSPSAKLDLVNGGSFSSDVDVFNLTLNKIGGTAVTNVKGVNLNVGSNDHVAGNDITNLYGAYINNSTDGSSATVISNWYGVYVPAADADRVSNRVSAYFGDNVGIGTTSPASLLHVAGTVQVGIDDTGHDVKFYGATAGKYLLWDESDDSLNFTDSTYIKLGNSADLRLIHDGTTSKIQNFGGNLEIEQRVDDADLILKSDDGSGGTTPYLTLDGSSKRNIFSENVVIANKYLYFGTYLNAHIRHDGSNLTLANTAGNITFTQSTDDGDIIFQSDDGAGGVTAYLTLDGSHSRLNVPDNIQLTIGTGIDSKMYHNGTNTYFENVTGDWYFDNHSNDKDIIFRNDNGSGGVETYFFLDGSASQVKFNVDVKLHDNDIIRIGDSDDFKIFHSGAYSFIQADGTGDLIIEQKTADKDIIFKCDDGSGGETAYIHLDGSAARTVFSRETQHSDNVKGKFGSSGDLQIYHDGTYNVIKAMSGHMLIKQDSDDQDIIFQSDDGSGGTTTYLTLDGSAGYTTAQKEIRMADSAPLRVGTGGDTRLMHDGNNVYFENWTGSFNIRQHTDDGDMIFQCDDGSGGVTTYFQLDGSHTETVFNESARFDDSKEARFGTSSDLKIYHNGSNSYLQQRGTGNLYIMNTTNDADIIFTCDDGSGGTATYLTLDGGAERINVEKFMRFADNVGAYFGYSYDLRLYHDGTDSYIESDGVGDLYITQKNDDKDIIFKCDDGSGGTETYFLLDGSASSGNPVTIFPDNSKLAIGTSSHGISLVHDGSDSTITNAIGDLTITNFQNDGDIIFQSDDGSGGTTAYLTLDGRGEEVVFSKPIVTAETQIKILPHQFMSNEDGGVNKSAQFRDDTIIGVRSTADDSELYAFVEIPYGKTATNVTVYGNDASLAVNVYESDINAGALTDKTPGGGCVVGDVCDITDVAYSATNYLVIKVTTVNYTNDIVYGAVVTIT